MRVWLTRLALGVVVVAVLVVLVLFLNPFRQKSIEPGYSTSSPKSVAVLPFIDLSPEKDQAYFCDGMTEALINRLGSVRELRVPARTSAFMFKGKERNIHEIGQALQVQSVLEGSVQKSGDRLRINAQLVNVDDGYQIWSQAFDRQMQDVFAIQDEISSAIVNAFRLSLTPQERQQLSQSPINNIAAYECYLKAYSNIRLFNAALLDSAIGYLKEGITLAGDNPLLYAAMAQAYWQRVNIGAGQEDDIAKAEQYAKTALALDPGFATANEALASIYKDFLGNPREGIRYYKLALATNPNETDALRKLAYSYIVIVDRPSKAPDLIGRAKQVDPLDPWKYFMEGMQRFYAGSYPSAAEPFGAFYQAEKSNPLAQFFYAWALVFDGKRNEAFALIDQSKRTTPENVCTKLALLLKHGLSNERQQALRVMTADFVRTCRRDPEWSYYVGLMLSLCEAKAEALDWLENAVGRGFCNYSQIRNHPYLDPLRGEKRFETLVERVKKEWETWQ